MTAPPRSYRLAQVFTAYVIAVCGLLTAASIALRAGARAVEKSIEATA